VAIASAHAASFPQSLDDTSDHASNCGRDALSMRTIQLLTERTELALFELTNLDPAPAVGRADDCSVHRLEHRPLAERMRDDLRATSFLEKETLEKIGRANDLAMA
jgi:hypothetical protein